VIEAQEKLKSMVKQLYNGIKYFQYLPTESLEMEGKIKIKNIDLEGVYPSMDNLNKCPEEKLDAPQDIP
jgi:hypothetical protein